MARREVEVRRTKAGRLREALESWDGPLRFPNVLTGGLSGFLRLPVLLSQPLEDHRALRRLGIYKAYPKTLADLDTAIHPLSRGDGPLPGSRELADRLFTVPTHSMVPEDRLVPEAKAILGG